MKRFLSKFAFVSALILACAPMAVNASAQQSHGIAAVVNDDVITTWDLKQRALFMMRTQGIEPTEEAQKQILQQAMRNLVDEKLELQEAKKYNQTISEQSIDNGVATIINRNGISVEEFAKRLAKQGVSINTLRDQVKAEIAWQRIISGLYGSRIRISDAQIDETLNRLTAAANKPSYRVSEIYIEASPEIGGMDGAMQGALAMIEQIKKGAPFPVLARQFSSATTAANGGEVGWVHEGELREELDNVIKKMKKGDISTPIVVPGGVYVIALIDKKVSESETFYTLKQVNYSYDDDTQLPQARIAMQKAQSAAKTCDTLEKDVKDIDGIKAAEMGEIKASDLNDQILDMLAKTDVGKVSEPITIPGKLVAIMVCKRDVRGSNIPSRDEVENRLMSQQEAQASKRHLRNLRRKATIVTR